MIIEIENKMYPEILKKIKKPPKKLYLKGNIKILQEPGIAIIGSRNCSKYGENMATKFSKNLAQYNLNIISGMAIGIDSWAHKGALECGGKTIAVLPCGLDNIYPKENIDLYNKIINNGGLVLTEYENDIKADYNKFLERNRIVSGLSIGTLVIEGGKRSGTSVTARLTKEQNKLVFCIPSSLENPKGITPNNLIKQGNILVTQVEDIIQKYPELNLKIIKNKKKKIEEVIEKEYKEVYKIIPEEGTIHINEILKKLNLGIQEINYKLMMLELEDKIVSLPGQNYKRK